MGQDPSKMFDPSISKIPVKNPYLGNPPPDFPSLKNFASSSQINMPIQKVGDSEVSDDSVEEIRKELKGGDVGSLNPQNDPYYLIRELSRKNQTAKAQLKLPPKSNELSLNINKNSLDNSLQSEHSNGNKKTNNYGPDHSDQKDAPPLQGAQGYISRIMNKTNHQAPPHAPVTGYADPYLQPVSHNQARHQAEQYALSSNRPEPKYSGNDLHYGQNKDSGSFNRSSSNLNNSLSQIGEGKHNMGGQGSYPSNSYVHNIIRTNNPNLNKNMGGHRDMAINSHNERGQGEDQRPGKFIEEVFHSEELKVLKDSNTYRDLKLENIFEKDTITIPVKGNPPMSEILNSSQIKDPVLPNNEESFTSNNNYSNSFGKCKCCS